MLSSMPSFQSSAEGMNLTRNQKPGGSLWLLQDTLWESGLEGCKPSACVVLVPIELDQLLLSDIKSRPA
jgi:hypothetical protein